MTKFKINDPVQLDAGIYEGEYGRVTSVLEYMDGRETEYNVNVGHKYVLMRESQLIGPQDILKEANSLYPTDLSQGPDMTGGPVGADEPIPESEYNPYEEETGDN